LTLGYYDNFPPNIHHVESYVSTVSSRQLQRRLIQFFGDVNRKEFTFEEVAIPTVPQGVVIFEFGVAETGDFNFLNEDEVKKVFDLVSKAQVQTLDFFCSIRYYKGGGGKRTALKFDYYMLRTVFGKGTFEVQVFHERGPRYVSPQEITAFLVTNLNGASGRKVLKEQLL
jgi:hypothetical protein